jgi:hypothetical protein
MAPVEQPPAIPERMSFACARFFAADWEATSFLEFFVDLNLRVSEDPSGGVGRTGARLADHARFALQLTLVRSMDSFVAYLAEVALVVSTKRSSSSWSLLWTVDALKERDGPSELNAREGVPVDLSLEYVATLAHGNVRLLDRLFAEATDIKLFATPEDLERISRLASLRNLIAHGRVFAAEDLAALVEETASVGGLGLRLVTFREDLAFLRSSVARVDECSAQLWNIDRPITSDRLFEAISSASAASSESFTTREASETGPGQIKA